MCKMGSHFTLVFRLKFGLLSNPILTFKQAFNYFITLWCIHHWPQYLSFADQNFCTSNDDCPGSTCDTATMRCMWNSHKTIPRAYRILRTITNDRGITGSQDIKVLWKHIYIYDIISTYRPSLLARLSHNRPITIWTPFVFYGEINRTSIVTYIVVLCFNRPMLLIMTSSKGNIFRVTGPLWGEFTGHRWIPLTKASDAELWCFFDLRLNKW